MCDTLWFYCLDVNIELAILKNKQDGEYGPPPPSASQPFSIHKSELSRSPSHMSVDSISSDASPNPVRMVQEMVGRVKVTYIYTYI